MAVVKKAKKDQANMKDVLKRERRLPGDKSDAANKKGGDDDYDPNQKVGYFRGSWRELRRVTWPGRKEAWKLTFAVIVFTLLLTGFTTGLDFILEKVVREIFL